MGLLLLLVSLLMVTANQARIPGPGGTPGVPAGCPASSLPYTDPFTTPGVLDPCWTQTTATGYSVTVPIYISAPGQVMANSGATGTRGYAMFTGLATGSTSSVATAFHYTAGNFSGLGYSDVAGNGLYFIASIGQIRSTANGADSGLITNGCTPITTGDVVKVINNGTTYVVTDVTAGNTTLCSGGTATSGWLPAMMLDQFFAVGDSFGTVTVTS